MKKPIRLLAMLMTFLMFATMTYVGASAQRYDYSTVEEGAYDAVGRPYLSLNQMGTMLLDILDDMLAERAMYQTFGFDITIASYYLVFDFTSIDASIKSIKDLGDDGLLGFVDGVLGDIEDINYRYIDSCPTRDAGGVPDYNIIYYLCNFLQDNASHIGNVVDGSFDLGVVDWFSGIRSLTGNIPQIAKEKIYEILFKEAPTAAVSTASSVDSMIQEKFNQLLLGYTDSEGVYNDPLFENIDKSKINLQGTSTYDLLWNIVQALIKDMGVPALTDLLVDTAEIEVTEEYPYGNPAEVDMSVLSIIYGFIEYEIPAELANEPMRYIEDSVDYLFNVFIKKYINYVPDDPNDPSVISGLYLTNDFHSLLDNLLDLASSLVASFSAYPGIGIKTQEEIDVMNNEQKVAYIARVLLMTFVDYTNIPEDADTFREVVTWFLVNMAADYLPQIDYEGMIESGQINPATDGALTVLAGLIRFYLNANFPLDIPEYNSQGKSLSFDETLSSILDYFIRNYGGLLYLPANFNSMTVWQKFDHILFNNFLQKNWLPADIAQGAGADAGLAAGSVTYELIFNRILFAILDFDFEKLTSIFRENPGSELHTPFISVALNLIRRLANGLFNNNELIPWAFTSFEQLFTDSGLSNFVESLCRHLGTYHKKLFESLMPLVVNIGGLNTLPALSVWAPDGEYPYVDVATIEARIQEQLYGHYVSVTVNEDGYEVFAPEDFAPLYKYYDYELVRVEAIDIVNDYKEMTREAFTAKYTDYDLINAWYRLGYYFDRLTWRAPVNYSQLKREINRVADKIDEGVYREELHTKRTWEILQDSIYNAEETWLDSLMDYTEQLHQSEVSNARHTLIKAQKLMKDFVPLADYAQLNSTISDALNIQNLHWYYDTTVNYFRQTLNTALAFPVNYDEDDQLLVDTMKEDLQVAIEGLTFQPTIVNAAGSSTVLDEVNRRISGLRTGITALSVFNTFIGRVGDGTLNYHPTQNGYGTGTSVELIVFDDKTGQDLTDEDYTIVIYGDVDGDSYINASDAVYILLIINGNKDKLNLSDEALLACDANHDGNIDIFDYELVSKTALGTKDVSQV